jgi:hypothetical protein
VTEDAAEEVSGAEEEGGVVDVGDTARGISDRLTLCSVRLIS